MFDCTRCFGCAHQQRPPISIRMMRACARVCDRHVRACVFLNALCAHCTPIQLKRQLAAARLLGCWAVLADRLMSARRHCEKSNTCKATAEMLQNVTRARARVLANGHIELTRQRASKPKTERAAVHMVMAMATHRHAKTGRHKQTFHNLRSHCKIYLYDATH